ncbi:MAG: hypothetical protein QOI57_1123 [Rubrobacteraceae bacterium]|jgi:hypothetical protein|nr:hypothetical protein [Rubrobacteraceae bacterium]
MRAFNRIVVILLLAGLFALGVATVVYALDIDPYRLEDFVRTLGLDNFYQGLRNYVQNVENGKIDAFDVVVLGLIALLGLVLLILELKPRTPRRVRMQSGTYITRSAVENEVATAAEQDPEVLQSNVSIKAQRRPGAKVNVRASIRPGEDARSIQSKVRDQVQQHLARVGIPVSNLKVRIFESDPRETKTRVK